MDYLDGFKQYSGSLEQSKWVFNTLFLCCFKQYSGSLELDSLPADNEARLVLNNIVEV